MTAAPSAAVRDALLIAGADVLWVRDALRELERRARVNGAGAPARLRALLELADGIVVTSSRQASPALTLPDAGAVGDRIGTEEAAAVLGCTGRYVRHQCGQGRYLTARKSGGRWTLARAEVASVLEDRHRSA